MPDALPVKCSAPGCLRKPRVRFQGVAMCGMHEQRQTKYGSYDLPRRVTPEWRRCTIDGCGKRSRTRLGRLCEMHYYRHYLRGTVDDPVRKPKKVTRHGYYWSFSKTHPLAVSGGLVYEHRVVLYERIGPGVHACHWCKAEVEWRSKGRRNLVVDHLDGDKANNTPDNLLPACNRCNATRGLFMRWVMEHRDEPFLRRLFDEAKSQGAHGAAT